MISLNKTLQLFINGEEYDFSNQIKFSLHPTNFSSFVFNDCIKKENNSYPKNVKPVSIPREFSFAELRQDGKTIFFGLVNDLGRFSLFPNQIKTFSITISDFRQWLSLTKPINKVYFEKSPRFIINDLVDSLGEPRIQVGRLDFSTADDFIIKSYNTQDKTLYQIFKNVIERQTNSLLYFTFENDTLLINYKSKNSLENNYSEIELDFDSDFYEKYKLTDFNYDSETTDYYNYLSYVSDNVISKLPVQEKDLKMNDEKIILLNNPAKIDTNTNQTFLKNLKTNVTRIPIILNSTNKVDGKYYDFLFSPNNNTLEVREPNDDWVLTISYYIKQKLTLEAQNPNEITNISKISNTNGIVYKMEKFNDISNGDDLLAAVKADIQKYSKPNKVININSKEPIWDLMEVVNVKNSPIDDLNGRYIVKQVDGNFQISGNVVNSNYSYQLTQAHNLETILNKFDNQSFRDNPILEDDVILDLVETISEQYNLESSVDDLKITKIKETNLNLQFELQKNIMGDILPKYKLLKVGD